MRLNTTTETMTTGSGTATTMLGFQDGGRVPAVCPTRTTGFGSGMFLFVLGKCHRPVVRGFIRYRSSRTSSHETLVIREWRRNLDTVRGNIVLSQTLVMVAPAHFQYEQGFAQGRLDFYRLERDDAIDQEAQSDIGYPEGCSAYLGGLPEQEGADSTGLQIPYHPVRFPSHGGFLHEHL